MNLVAAALDKTDAAILEYLRQDARLSFRELGERVNLSANAARDRVRSLLSRGIITGFHAHIDPGRIDKRPNCQVAATSGPLESRGQGPLPRGLAVRVPSG